jgi:type 1 fimbria pilin
MSDAKLGVTRRAGQLALASAVLYAAMASAGTNGGVIYFTGAIVAPPFEVSVGPAAAASAATAPTRIDHASGRTAQVMFSAEPHESPSAELSMSVIGHGPASGARLLATRFTDSKGNTTPSRANGTYHVGRLGGTLSMRALDDTPASVTRVLLMTSYN